MTGSMFGSTAYYRSRTNFQVKAKTGCLIVDIGISCKHWNEIVITDIELNQFKVGVQNKIIIIKKN